MSSLPNEKEMKFDRQTRIWGAHGQNAIESAHVCVLGASATATEVLKNLVLPNVGNFTIVDDQKVTQQDVETNFFVDASDVGKSRAEAARVQLLEMNDSVKGFVVHENPLHVIDSNLNFFLNYTVVIACQLPEQAVLKLGAFLYEKRIPFVNVRSVGFLGWMRIAVPEVLVVETHYENNRFDMFLHPDQLQHFPELAEYCRGFDLNVESSQDHKYIPYVAILVQLLDKWRAEHNGEVPSSKDRDAFKNSILAAARDFKNEVNFQEAITNAHRVYSKTTPDDDVLEALDNPHCDNLNAQSDDFWVLLQAVKQFMAAEGHGFLPVSSDIPDITTKTEHFIRLKEIFAARAVQELDAVCRHLARILTTLGRPADAISRHQADFFVKNIRGIKAVQIRSLAEEYSPQTFYSAEIMEGIDEEKWNEAPPPLDQGEDGYPLLPKAKTPNPREYHWYLALRAADRFFTLHGRYPGAAADGQVDADVAELKRLETEFLAEYQLTDVPVNEDCLREVARCGGAEIHTISALMGGVAAQEILKLILRQFKPLNNTFLHNGLYGRSYGLKY